MFIPLPDYQLKRLQKVQNTCAGYVLSIEKFAGLGWLPIKVAQKLGLNKHDKGTFQDEAANIFNNLPAEIRNCRGYLQFSRDMKNFPNEV